MSEPVASQPTASASDKIVPLPQHGSRSRPGLPPARVQAPFVLSLPPPRGRAGRSALRRFRRTRLRPGVGHRARTGCRVVGGRTRCRLCRRSPARLQGPGMGGAVISSVSRFPSPGRVVAKNRWRLGRSLAVSSLARPVIPANVPHRPRVLVQALRQQIAQMALFSPEIELVGLVPPA
jgi:hypothetical protein